MATRKNNSLGNISGKLGNTVTRIRNGKEVVYLLPDKVNVSNSPSAKAARRKFGLKVKFAKLINSIPVLSDVWSVAQIHGSNSNQRLISHNPIPKDEMNLTMKNIITPSGDLPAPLNHSYKNNLITMEIDSKLRSSLPLIIHLVLFFYELNDTQQNDYSMEYIQKLIDDTETTGNTPVSFKLNGTQKELFKKHNHCILYSALTSSKQKIKWSPTSSFTLK